ncbi:hypothetical protein [Fibrobacter sp.]|uniref:hypothetical protein n=1 Tax=Fibrobacter sp. TaxID=35828 RepID=UPI00388D1674
MKTSIILLKEYNKIEKKRKVPTALSGPCCINRKPPAGLVVLKKPSGGDEKSPLVKFVVRSGHCITTQQEDQSWKI